MSIGTRPPGDMPDHPVDPRDSDTRNRDTRESDTRNRDTAGVAGRVRVGAIGPGWWMETMYVPAVDAHPDADLVAICGRDRARVTRFAEAHGIAHVFTDPAEMFASGLIDAVIISTVNRLHAPLSLAAIAAGLHVLCEKPLAMDASEATTVAAAARSAGLTCLVPFTYRFMPVSQYLKRLIDDGFVGRPYLLNLRYYAGYARDGSYLWRFDPAEAGGGVIADLGTHWLDHARWLFGEIEAVTCVLGHHVERSPRPDGSIYEPGDDGASIIVEFAGGARGVIVVSAVCHEDSSFGQSHFFDVFGADGTLYGVNDWIATQQVRGARAGEAIRDLPIPDDIWGGARRERVHDTYRDVFRHHDVLARGWISAIRGGAGVAPDFDDGAAVQRAVEACQRSAAEGRRVALSEIDPQASPAQ